MEDVSQQVARRVRAATAAKAPTTPISELARRIGLTYKVFARRISGEQPFKAPDIVRLSRELGVPVGQLMGTEPLELDR
ncbi:hypothetical protein [Nocardia cyriacigeorgica]|uniref:hypothetical protein n=1 Tax=Nocardia cyriacigeorgica TaxID=135487 RepID=UPI0024558F81|nr:hypothetical protein [Nocardia cyriacigeorgica]